MKFRLAQTFLTLISQFPDSSPSSSDDAIDFEKLEELVSSGVFALDPSQVAIRTSPRKSKRRRSGGGDDMEADAEESEEVRQSKKLEMMKKVLMVRLKRIGELKGSERKAEDVVMS